MADPVGGCPCEGHRVGAADQEVAGVEGEPDRAPVEDAIDFVRPLDHRADVGVKRGLDALLTGDVADPVQVGEEQLPLRLIEGRALVVPLQAGGGGEHQAGRAGGTEVRQRALDVGQRVPAVVEQHDRDEPADRTHVVHGQELGSRLRIGRQEAVGAELGGGQAEVGHLPQHPLGGHLMAPAGHLADAPRDRCGGDPVGERGGHSRTSATSMRRPSSRDRVAASATYSASSASSTEHGVGRSPLTTSRKAFISAS